MYCIISTADASFRLFAAYGSMEITVQESIQRLITPLVRALGPSHGKLLALLRTFRSESLALRVLNILTENGRPSSQLVSLVKSLISEPDLDARFLIPIIAEMDKVRRPFVCARGQCVLTDRSRRTSYDICPALCPSSTGHKRPRPWSARCSDPS